MMKVSQEFKVAEGREGFQDFRTETNYHAKKFYAQRNVYLTGFTLFLSLILARTHSLVLDLINTQEELVANSPTKAVSGDVKKYQTEIETMKKQMQQQQTEYNRLSDELAKAQSNVSDKKSD
ncbi:Endoplasmic reticulum transmembrane protein 3 [Malassezia pachydermatis]